MNCIINVLKSECSSQLQTEAFYYSKKSEYGFVAKDELSINDFTKVKTIIMDSIIIRLFQQNSTVALFRTPDPVRSFYMVRFAGERGPLAKKLDRKVVCRRS